MKIFIDNVLPSIKEVFQNIQFDTLLHGKQENFISASIAAKANSTLDPKGKMYYANQKNNIDMVRIVDNKIELCCEFKFDYTSDLNKKMKRVNIKDDQKGFEKLKKINGLVIPYISHRLCYGLEQVEKYENNLPHLLQKNRVVVLNMIFAPYGTRGKTCENSEIKILDDERIKYDKDVRKQTKIISAPSYFENIIRNLPGVLGLYPKLRCVFRDYTRLKSRYEFSYYIITLAFSE